MADLEKDLDELARVGRSEAARGRPPSNALEPDAYELGERHKIELRYQSFETNVLNQLGEVGQKVSRIEQNLTQLKTSAPNLSDTKSIATAMDVAISEKRSTFVRAIMNAMETRAHLLRFKGDHGIQREARYDPSTWAVIHWMVIIFAFELLLNTYFYSLNVGLAGGVFAAAILAGITAIVGYLIGLGFRLVHERDLLRKLAGGSVFLVGSAFIFYVASLTAIYRSITFVQREQELSGVATAVVYTPAYVAFTQAMSKAPQIFLFPVTLRLPFDDLQSALLFSISIVAFGVAFWKGYTSQDVIIGYKAVDKAAKEAEAHVHDQEQGLIAIAKQAAYSCVAERREIIDGFKTAGLGLATSKTEIDSLRANLKSTARALTAEYSRRIESYRNAIVQVLQTKPPQYFQDAARITFDTHDAEFDSALSRVDEQKATLAGLSSAYEDRLKAEMADASGQAVVANEHVAAFMADCKREAEREMQEEQKVMGRTADPVAL